ncbi:trypsin-like serine peptidase [Pseudomonadota bacterium]
MVYPALPEPIRHAPAQLPRAIRSLAAVVALALAPMQWSGAEPADEAVADRREIYSPASPAWLRAVGKLQVPGSRYSAGRRTHLQENCSATLVVSAAARSADTIITAWHCLADYSDLSKPITFTLSPDLPGTAQRQAYRLADGGGMHADWAILRLFRPVAVQEAQALAVHHGRADTGRDITMAGYSRDTGKGAAGSRLTFDRNCRITAQAPEASQSNCIAHKGASGGAVVQLSAEQLPLYSGVISEGNGAGLSTFVPVASFRDELARHLR